MVFNSLIFLAVFLPLFLIAYFICVPKYRNILALIASVIFFAFAQPYYLILMAALVLLDYLLARWIESCREDSRKTRLIFLAGCFLNLLPLVFFKIIAARGPALAAALFPESFLKVLQAYLAPLGLSYITFQLLSYLVDVRKGLVKAEKSLISFALYVLMFPKLLVGPITRYRDLSAQLSARDVNASTTAAGIRRFLIGLAKKILIADTIASCINPAFSLSTPNFSTGIAWFVIVGYALQLYFDFSGFTDMAIGLGNILGFRFAENFNYPYISKSISDFWRRWHITLSSWFREYVFYPLEHVRSKAKLKVQPLNILIVFALTGLWHGLTWNFLAWGLLQGLAIVLETTFLGSWLKKLWRPFQHLYALILILIGWVFFRSPSLPFALQFLARLVGSSNGITPLPYFVTQPLPIIDNTVWMAVIAGIILSVPVLPAVGKLWDRAVEKHAFLANTARPILDAGLLILLILAASAIVSRAIAPVNIYAKF